MSLPPINSKFLRVELTPEIVHAKAVVNILNARSGSELAKVFWYGPWKRFCWMQAAQNVVFSDDCSDAIGKFCREMNAISNSGESAIEGKEKV